MSEVKQVDVATAQGLIEEELAVLVDIRDPDSFATSHSKTAIHLSNDSIVNFLNETDFDQPILVMCYHGVSSVGAAEYLENQGYSEVYSVKGGFAAWNAEELPIERG